MFELKKHLSWVMVITLLIPLLFHSPLHAGVKSGSTQWKKINIPNAYCGNGEGYSVFTRIKDPKKVAFGFDGGGVCWSRSTCFGFMPTTDLRPKRSVTQSSGLVSQDYEKNVLADHSQIYFPYCTGDVYIGRHVADYGGNHYKAHHYGHTNVVKSMQYLKEHNLISFDDIENATLYGYSAGAVGALVHVSTIDPYLPASAERSLLADSPGMHFGKTFWHKFTNEQMQDFIASFHLIGLTIDQNDGLVAKQMPNYCRKYSAWNIGVLQSSRDFIMSKFFGNISANEHHRLVFGPEGLFRLTEEIGDNCSAWVPNSDKHTFLQSDSDAIGKIDNKSAMDFARDVVLRLDGKNYRGELINLEQQWEDDIDYN